MYAHNILHNSDFEDLMDELIGPDILEIEREMEKDFQENGFEMDESKTLLKDESTSECYPHADTLI